MPENNEQQDPGTEFDGPSKSALKREMTALQELGERLVTLPDRQLGQIPIDDQQLLDAITLARRITTRSGRRRQLQFIGKLMRHIDPEPIREALARLDGTHRDNNARFHRLETLRDDLIHRGDRALSAVLEIYPQADRQHLRQLLRQHAAEENAGKPPAAARKIFRYLRELDAGSGTSDTAVPED